MKAPKILCSIAALAFSLTASQAVETDPVGFVSITVPANSDATIAVPMNRPSEFKGVISSISGNILTVTGSPAWTVNQFVFNGTTQLKTYALQLASGTKEGLICKITANSANTITVQLPVGENLTGVASGVSGDSLDIMPYWTPASLFTTGSIPTDSSILLLSTTSAGVNLSSVGIYGFDGTNWSDEGFNSADHAPLSFGQAFVLRTGNAAATVSLVGSVPMNKHRVILNVATANTDQDIAIGFSSPVPTAIGSVGLNFTEGDSLLVYDNTTSGINKAAAQILSYTAGDGWIDEGFNAVGTTFKLQPGQGYIFRKAGVSTTTPIVWTSLQSYLQ